MNKRKIALLISTFLTISSISFVTANADDLAIDNTASLSQNAEVDTDKAQAEKPISEVYNFQYEASPETPSVEMSNLPIVLDEYREISTNLSLDNEVKIVDTDYELHYINTHGKDAIQVRFTLSQDVDLSKYIITISSETKEKYTGLWWKNFLVNAETNVKYGLNGTIPAGTYLTDFTVSQIDLYDSFENFTVTLAEKSSNKVVSQMHFTAEHPFAQGQEEGFGPEGDVMPQVDPDKAPANDGFGAEGNVTPELDPPVLDGTAEDDFLVTSPDEEKPEDLEDTSPEITPEDDTLTPETEEGTKETLPQTGGAGNSLLIGLGSLFTVAGALLFKIKK